MFSKVKEGYCRCDGRKCRHMRIGTKGKGAGKAWCKKTYTYRYIVDDENNIIRVTKNKEKDIEAPKWCPKKQ